MCFFSAPSPPPLPPLPPLPEKSDAEVQAAALAERLRAARARGRAATILTSGLGDLSSAPVTAKTLLGQ
ncbi:MAG: hypothetical protein WCF16_02195 [Alphaproteobacteria bacterium]